METVNINRFKEKVSRYIESLRVNKFHYKYSKSAQKPVLYALDYVLLTRYLFGENVSSDEKEEISSYVQSFQDEDGLFKDPAVADGPFDAEYWGWRHLTRHSFMALSALGKIPEKEFSFLEPFYNPDFVINWLNEKDFTTPEKVDNAAMEIYNSGSLLQYSRDFHNNRKAKKPAEIILDWLSEKQFSKHGFWGPEKWEGINDHSNLMMAAYHLYILYFYEGLTLNYKEKIIDNVLSLQNERGGFPGPHHPLSSACQDLDAIYVLAQLADETNYKSFEIEDSLKRAVPCILSHQNDDGGFLFYKDREFKYGSVQMYSGVNESAMFPTWFRTLSLAFVSKVISEITQNFQWQFLPCPGAQLWRSG